MTNSTPSDCQPKSAADGMRVGDFSVGDCVAPLVVVVALDTLAMGPSIARPGPLPALRRDAVAAITAATTPKVPVTTAILTPVLPPPPGTPGAGYPLGIELPPDIITSA